MAISFRRFLKGILLKGETTDPTDNLSGSVWHNSASGRLKAYIESAVRVVVSENQTQTLTNKSIDSDNNILTNIKNADIKSSAGIDATKIADGSVNNTEFQYINNLTSNAQTQLDTLTTTTSGKVSKSGDTMTGSLILAGDPTTSNEAATKNYVDGVAQGLNLKEEARVATTVAGTLATDFENGDTVDGVVLATNDRILIKNQVSQSENGIYVVQASGAPTRATDSNTWVKLIKAYVFVQHGTVNAASSWVANTSAGGTLGITSIPFNQYTQLGEITTDEQGITKIGQQVSLVLDGSTLSKSGSGIKVSTNGISNTELSQIATQKFKGRTTAGTGNVEDLTSTQATAILNTMVGDSGSGGTKGLVPAPTTGDATKYLRGDATWATVSNASGHYQEFYYQNAFDVRVASTGNVNLSSAVENNDVIDGVTLATGNYVLLKNQTSSTENGVYIVKASGTPDRHTSYDTGAEITRAQIHVTNGTVNANTRWVQLNTVSNIASDSQSWSNSSSSISYTVPTGVTELDIEIAAGGGGGGGGGNMGASATANAGGGGGSGGTGNSPFTLKQPVTAGDVLSITLGLGGVGGLNNANGSDGGTTIITGTGWTVSVLGSAGGLSGVSGTSPGRAGGAAVATNIAQKLIQIGSGVGGNGNGGAAVGGGNAARGGTSGAGEDSLRASGGTSVSAGSNLAGGGAGGSGGAGKEVGGTGGTVNSATGPSNGNNGNHGGISAGGGGGNGATNNNVGSKTGGYGGVGGSGYVRLSWVV